MPDYREPETALGRRLGWLRAQRGLTQQDLARRLGLTQSAVSRIESGDRRLSATQLIRWAEVLDVDLATLAEPEEAGATAPQTSLATQAPLGWSPEAEVLSGEGTPRRDVRDEGEPVERMLGPEVVSPALPPAPGHSPGYAGTALRRGIVAKRTGVDDRLLLRDAVAESPTGSATGGAAADRGYPLARGQRLTHGYQVASSPSFAERHGVTGALALEPASFADVVADALDLEELAVRHGLQPTTHVSWAERRLIGPLSPEPARAARFWRHELGVGVEGPLPDLVTLLEEAGVYVVHARLDEQVPAGACAEVTSPAFPSVSPRTPSPRTPDRSSATAPLLPFVFVNGARPVVLQRFALAHEFAHLALGHRDAYDERIDWSGRSGREVSANAFAEEFTAPSAAVRRWCEARGEPGVDVELVVDLANHFGISFWAARYRLRAAGRLPTRRLRELDDRVRRQEWELIPRQTFLGGLRDTLSLLTAESRCDAERQSEQRRGPESDRTGTPGAEGRDAAEQGANLLRVAPRGVRVPARTRALALALLQRGIISLEQAAALLRFDVPSLREQTARLGL